jgi:hypothetical protein
VQALFWYGSHSIGRAGPDSDLDAAVLIAAGTNLDEVAKRIDACLEGMRRHTIGPVQGRYHVWCTDDLIKVDFVLARSPEELRWLADAADVPPPRLVEGVIKTAADKALLDEAGRPHRIDVAARIDEEVQKFLVGFEACSALQRRSDCYGFYFQYNLALHRVARLLQIAKRGPERLYLPPQLTTECLSEADRQRFIDLAAPMYLPEANDAKRRLLTLFLEVLDELNARHFIRWSRTRVSAFLDDIVQRDLFYNVRDVAQWTHPHLQPGRLFRTSKLSRWQQSPYLRPWLEKHRIGLIIDLRGLGEDEEYNPEILAGIEYCRAPIPQGHNEAYEQVDPTTKGDGYYIWMKANRNSLVRGIYALAQKRVPTVIHCKAGRDRTGCFVALVGMLIGIPTEAIIDDYAATGNGADRRTMERFIQQVVADNGPLSFLGPGLTSRDVTRLREWLSWSDQNPFQ